MRTSSYEETHPPVAYDFKGKNHMVQKQFRKIAEISTKVKGFEEGLR